MNNEIVNSLVEIYKEKGVSLDALLRDPLFLSFPPEKQVEALQAYAGVLAQGSKAQPQYSYLLKAVLKGAGAGLFAGLPLMAKYKNNQTKAMLGLGTIGAGAIIGGLSGKLSYNSERDRYEKTNKYLIRLSKTQNPDTQNSVRVLDMNRKFEPVTFSSILKSRASPEQALIEKSVGFGDKSTESVLKELEPK